MIKRIFISNKRKDDKRLVVNIFASIGIKGFSLIINFLLTSAYLNYFSDNIVVGVWFSILSVLNWILMFDMGIGNGLRNRLVNALVNQDTNASRQYISSSYFIIGIITVLSAIIGYILIGFVNLNWLFNIPTNVIDASVLVLSIRILYLGITLQLFFKLIQSIFFSMQKAAIANMLLPIAQFIILLFVRNNNFAIPLSEKIIKLSYVYSITINMPLIVATFIFFVFSKRELAPNIKYYNKDKALDIIKLGYRFFIIQLSLLVINSSNQLLISKLFSPEFTVVYQVYYRMFSLSLLFFTIILVPIWSAITKSYAERDIKRIVRVYRIIVIIGVAISISMIILLPIYQSCFNIWLGEGVIDVNVKTVILFSTFYSIMIFYNAGTCVANGVNRLKPQLIGNFIASVIKIPLSYFVAQRIDSWQIIMIIDILIMFPVMCYQTIDVLKFLNINKGNKKINV